MPSSPCLVIGQFALAMLLLPGCTSKPAESVRSSEISQKQRQLSSIPDFTKLASNIPYQEKLIGSEACAKCHAEQWQSYKLTPHSSALSTVNPDAEPEDGSFVHELSGRRYEIYRKDGKLWHRESSIASGADQIVDDRELKYLVGSGHHSRTYLVEADGFLTESPITWYSARKAWDLSPGYNHPGHEGFARPIDAGCMYCHSGFFETVDGSQCKLKFHELAIGCERCHGPGRDHAERQTLTNSAGETVRESLTDPTIVNPARLSRELAESICSDCHLRGEATVTAPGRQLTDFLPGMPLEEVRTDYRVEQDEAEMKVVGHVEQMHASACYLKSDTMTCTTCHSPHRAMLATRGDYRATCLTCHEEASCGLDLATRIAQAPGDDCLTCHMPQVKTDIPHIAFTHHRIGIHHQTAPSPTTPHQLGRLQAILKKPGDHDVEDVRSLGLGYLEISAKQPTEQLQQAAIAQARQLLEATLTRNSADLEVLASLGRIRWYDSLDVAEAYCLEALKKPEELSGSARVNTLFILADCAYARRRPNQAIEHLNQLTKLRHNSEDWLLLAECYYVTGSPEAAAQALRKAAEISPFREDIQARLRSPR